MKKRNLFYVIGFLIFLGSCHNTEIPVNTNTEDLQNVVVSDNFNWKVRSEILFEVTVPYEGVVFIRSEDGSTIYAKGRSFNNLFKKRVVIPSYEEKVRIEFGSSNNIVSISGQEKITYTFMQLKSATTGDNLVDNGDFEDNNYNYNTENTLTANISSNTLDVWTFKNHQNNKPNTDIDDDNNNNFVKMTDNKDNKYTFAYYYLDADPNVEYSLSIDGRVEDFDNNDFEPYIELRFLSSNGQEINSYDQNVMATSWTSYTITQTSPLNTTYIQVVMATSDDGKGEVWFDNVVLTGADDDADGDGIADDEDDYPNDATRAFNSFYPADGYGRLAFEDTWPAKADYDFNDLVMEYRFMVVTNASGYVVEMIDTFNIKNIGAGYTNGFGFQLPGNNASWYSSVSGVVNNSFESGQTYPTVMLFNSSDHNYEGMSYVVTFTMATNAADEIDVYVEGWNPFVTANGVRGHEIHLPYYLPTDLADLTLFGTNFDDTDPSGFSSKTVSVKTYLTPANLPWAIDVSDDFVWTTERTPINLGYNYFTDWATSGGTNYTDWYLPNGASGVSSGYRNTNYIDNE